MGVNKEELIPFFGKEVTMILEGGAQVDGVLQWKKIKGRVFIFIGKELIDTKRIVRVRLYCPKGYERCTEECPHFAEVARETSSGTSCLFKDPTYSRLFANR